MTTVWRINLTARLCAAANLGHCWSGALPLHHAELLSVGARADPGVRHQLPADLRLFAGLAARDTGVRERQGAENPRR